MKWIATDKETDNMVNKHWRSAISHAPISVGIAYNMLKKGEVVEYLDESEDNGWISVEDRLPKDAECVLVYCSTAKQDCKMTVGMRVKELYGFYTDDEGLCNVTHWQPLPPAPIKP